MKPGISVRRVMSISHAEFLRSLIPLGKHYPYRIDESEGRILLTDHDRQIEIRLGREGRRRLGALELPETAVDFHFHASDPTTVERFFARFDLCFRRGGG
ncbi:MAG: hypothetical protein P8103_02440 [Candidatus Thiodiazotropha sp.]|jgi:hypothetical protein